MTIPGFARTPLVCSRTFNLFKYNAINYQSMPNNMGMALWAFYFINYIKCSQRHLSAPFGNNWSEAPIVLLDHLRMTKIVEKFKIVLLSLGALIFKKGFNSINIKALNKCISLLNENYEPISIKKQKFKSCFRLISSQIPNPLHVPSRYKSFFFNRQKLISVKRPQYHFPRQWK